MPRSLPAACLALALAGAAASSALASPLHDFAGSRTPPGARHRAGSGTAQAAQLLGGAIGPDVSNWNGCSIDWFLVSPLRAFGFAKATEGAGFTDGCFATNWWGMAAAGMVRGAYHFARPRLPISSARDQARRYVAVVNSAGGFQNALPPVLDVEVNSRRLSRLGLRAWIRAWIREVRAETHRYWVTIYTGNWFWRPKVGSWSPRGTLLWASGYSDRPPRVAGFANPSWWQYTDGSVGPDPRETPGIGPSDHSLWLGTPATLASLRR